MIILSIFYYWKQNIVSKLLSLTERGVKMWQKSMCLTWCKEYANKGVVLKELSIILHFTCPCLCIRYGTSIYFYKLEFTKMYTSKVWNNAPLKRIEMNVCFLEMSWEIKWNNTYWCNFRSLFGWYHNQPK